jgi:hypothetical protein
VDQEERVDTLVDPVEMVSSSHLPAAPAAGGMRGPRASMPTLDPEVQVQWFSRVFEDEAASSVDVEVFWEEESDTCPTLVRRRTQ